jgi:hypothetical protein
MQEDFLKQFPRRMRTVGLYSKLLTNIILKNRWSVYGFEDYDARINLVFAVLLFIMENNLSDTSCTLDDVSLFVEKIITKSFHKEILIEDARSFSDFILNTVLSNEGKVMNFMGHNFESDEDREIPISYISNEAKETESGRKVAYKLTYEGYNLVLGTMEVEDNLKIPISEMILREQINNQDYDKALITVRDIFAQLLALGDKIETAKLRIKRNVSGYSVEEYEQLITENHEIMKNAQKQLGVHREKIHDKITHFYENEGNDYEEMDTKMHALSEIEKILQKELGVIQDILNKHLSYYKLYIDAVENQLVEAPVKRFDIKEDLYERFVKAPQALENFSMFLQPLFFKAPKKTYNVNKVFEKQVVRGREDELTADVFEEMDQQEIYEEEKRKREESLKKYHDSLQVILEFVYRHHTSTLSTLKAEISNHDSLVKALMPDLETFKGILVSLLKADLIDVNAMRHESQMIEEETMVYELNRMSFEIIQEEGWREVSAIVVKTLPQEVTFIFENKQITTTDVAITMKGEHYESRRVSDGQ